MGTRITIDSLTCLLANESDPSRLVAISPGKLIRYLMPDGAHVATDQPYAEVEVCSLPVALQQHGYPWLTLPLLACSCCSSDRIDGHLWVYDRTVLCQCKQCFPVVLRGFMPLQYSGSYTAVTWVSSGHRGTSCDLRRMYLEHLVCKRIFDAFSVIHLWKPDHGQLTSGPCTKEVMLSPA